MIMLYETAASVFLGDTPVGFEEANGRQQGVKNGFCLRPLTAWKELNAATIT